MHLVFATSMVPQGTPASGYEIANAAILSALERVGCRVSVLGFAWEGREASPTGDTTVLGTMDPRTSNADMRTRLRWLSNALVHRMTFSSAKMRALPPQRVEAALQDLAPFDAVILNSVQFAGAFEALFAQHPFLYVAHNVEHVSARENAKAAKSLAARLLFRREARLLEALEQRLCQKARFVFTFAEDDIRALDMAGTRCAAVLPLVVGAKPPRARKAPQRLRYDAVLIGTWSWAPNRIGLDWFLEEVVPRLPKTFDIAIAGDIPSSLASLHPHVGFVGRVPDALEFLRSGRVVPLISRAGTGVQLKTIETFENGLPSVATRSALRGISHTPENCIIADDPEAFARALVEVAKAPRWESGKAFYETQRAALDDALKTGLAAAGLTVGKAAA